MGALSVCVCASRTLHVRGGARNIGTLFFGIQCVATFGVRSKGGVRVRPVHVVIIAFRGGVRRLAGDHATVAEAQLEDCAATSLGRRRHDLDLCTFQCPDKTDSGDSVVLFSGRIERGENQSSKA